MHELSHQVAGALAHEVARDVVDLLLILENVNLAFVHAVYKLIRQGVKLFLLQALLVVFKGTKHNEVRGKRAEKGKRGGFGVSMHIPVFSGLSSAV